MTALSPIRLGEKVAYGLGNVFPTLVTATGGMAMFFYTDVVGLGAALIGTALLLVRLIDAVWDIYVGRWVDRTRTRWGQGRPFLLWAAPAAALAFVLAFTVPPVEGTAARVAWVLFAYTALWWCYSLINIPFQSMPALIAPDPDQRLRLLGVNAFVLFIFVVGCGAGFPAAKDALAAGQPAQGFQRAAMVYALLGLVFTWITFAVVRERVAAPVAQTPDLRADAGALWDSRAWRAAIVALGLIALLIGLPLAAGVYYFVAVMKAPQLIGPFMGVSGLGLMAGVIVSDQLTRRVCKRRVMVLSSVAMGVLSMGYVAIPAGQPGLAIALAALVNVMLGIGAPISQSLLADTADAIELATGRRVVGTLFATVGFGQKIGAGAASAVVGAVLSLFGYAAGAPEQPAAALWGITLLMGPIPGLVALAIAAVLGWGYPIGQAELATLRDDLARRRALAPAPAA